MRIVGWVMQLAPLGVMALLAKLIATQDAAILASLAGFVVTMISTTLFHGLVILPGILYLVTRISPFAFWRGAKPALLTAFATSSSAATLPVTLRCLEEDMQVNPDIAGFVAPLGAQINMDGTALYEAAAALFIANLAGIELTLPNNSLFAHGDAGIGRSTWHTQRRTGDDGDGAAIRRSARRSHCHITAYRQSA